MMIKSRHLRKLEEVYNLNYPLLCEQLKLTMRNRGPLPRGFAGYQSQAWKT